MPLLLLKKEPPTLSSPLGSAAHLCFLESALFLPLVNLLSLVVLLAVWFAFLFQLPHGTDENWLQKLYNNFVNKNSLFEKPRMSNTSFIIQHFADKVQWESGAELSARGCLAVPWDEQASQGLFRSELSQLACSCDEEYLCVCKRVCVCVCVWVCVWVTVLYLALSHDTWVSIIFFKDKRIGSGPHFCFGAYCKFINRLWVYFFYEVVIIKTG